MDTTELTDYILVRREMELKDLNDDCLRHLYSFLSDIDIMTLVLISDRFDFDNLIDYLIIDRALRQFNFNEMEYILKRIGSKIKEFEQWNQNCTFNVLVEKYCQNIEKIYLCGELGFSRLAHIIFASSRLKVLIIRSGEKERVHLSALTQLETLDLFRCFVLAKDLKNMVNLKVLRLSNCDGILPFQYMDVFQSIKLEALRIDFFPEIWYFSIFITELVKTQTELQVLTIFIHHNEINSTPYYNENDILMLAQLKNLRYLEIEDMNLKRNGLECENDMLQFSGLKMLDLSRFNCSPRFLLKMLKMCTQLEEFLGKVSSADLVIEIISNLKCLKIFTTRSPIFGFDEEKFRRVVAIRKESNQTFPLRLNASSFGFGESFLLSDEYEKNTKFLNIGNDHI